MTQLTPEQKPESTPTVPSEIKEIPETPEIPPHIERAGVSTSTTVFTAKVTDDKGQNLTQSPVNQGVTITIPAMPEQLEVMAKGSPVSALTWLAKFWLRMIKKALHFGWKIVTKAPAPAFLTGQTPLHQDFAGQASPSLNTSGEQASPSLSTSTREDIKTKNKDYEEKLLEKMKEEKV